MLKNGTYIVGYMLLFQILVQARQAKYHNSIYHFQVNKLLTIQRNNIPHIDSAFQTSSTQCVLNEL